MAASPLELLGETVRALRIERGLTQEQLADLCGFHRTFVVSIEKGRQNASTITILRLANALRILPSELFRGFSKPVMRSLSL